MLIHWFTIAGTLLSGILGYKVCNGKALGKTTIGILFDIIGFGLAWFIAMLCCWLKKKPIIIIILSILIALYGYFVFTRNYVTYHYDDPLDKYKNVWKKDPNKWTEDEKRYVNSFFDWLDKEQK